MRAYTPNLPAGTYFELIETGAIFDEETEAQKACLEYSWTTTNGKLLSHPALVHLAQSQQRDTYATLLASELSAADTDALNDLIGPPQEHQTSTYKLHTIQPWLVTRQNPFGRDYLAVNINQGSRDNIPPDLLTGNALFPTSMPCATRQEAENTAVQWAKDWSRTTPGKPILITNDYADAFGDILGCYKNGRRVPERRWPDA